MIDFKEIEEYCSLSRQQIESVCAELGFKNAQDFSDNYEGLWTEAELIQKQQSFYDENDLGDYLSLHDKADYLCIQDIEDGSRLHWFNRP